MARTARTLSDSGVYHAILRGVNKQQIFECTEDYQRFLNILRTLTVQEQDESGHRSKPNCVVYAYCLMAEASQHISVTVNMKDASGNIVRTRTLSNVPMEPNRITRATGSFFHSAANSSFTLDTTLDPTYDFEF